MSWKDHIAENRRLAILKTLKDYNGSANDSVLKDTLYMLGFRSETRDSVRADIRFLIDNGLVADEWLNDIVICTITRRGVDVAEGRIAVEGIKKPSIGI